MASKKQQDALKAKQKRQKVIAIGGGVLLLALLAFQVPRTMKMMNAKAPATPPPAAAPVPTAVPTDPSVLPTPATAGGTAAPAAPAAAGGNTLVDSDLAPSAAAGQLVVFGRFSSKDPFHQQIDTSAPAAPVGSPATPATPGTPGSPATGSPEQPQPGSSGGVVSPTAGSPKPAPSPPSGPSAAAGTAVIAVNGAEEAVEKGASFPKDSPMFTLVSIGKGRANVAVAGGAFASGARTIALTKGKTVTLVNTADGTRYELKLVAAGG